MSAGRTVNTKSQNWCTPHKYVEAVSLFFGGRISLDPCSNKKSIVNAETEFMLPNTDGLSRIWIYPRIFVNPPYGRDRVRGTSISDWLYKCQTANELYGSEVLALIPVATNTSHWKRYVFRKASAICFLSDTRLKFMENGKESKKGAPMACAMVYWGNRIQYFQEIFSSYGAAINITDCRMQIGII